MIRTRNYLNTKLYPPVTPKIRMSETEKSIPMLPLAPSGDNLAFRFQTEAPQTLLIHESKL